MPGRRRPFRLTPKRGIGSAVYEMAQLDYPDIPLCTRAKARYPESHAHHQELGFARRGQSSVSREIVILGSGGHARVVADACSSAAQSIAGFIGPDASRGAAMEGAVHLGGDDRLEDRDFVQSHDFVVGIGAQQRRAELSRDLCERGARLATVVHASAVVAPSATLGAGTVVLAGAVVNQGAQLGSWVIVNTNATVDHDARLADGVHIGPGAVLAGDVT